MCNGALTLKPTKLRIAVAGALTAGYRGCAGGRVKRRA
jgi:hypothetical protein